MNKDLAEAIKSRRKRLGLTQVQLAELAECSVPFLIALEAGKETVRLDKVLGVLTTLGLQLRIEQGRDGISNRVDGQ